ncbi:hypothetical protein EZS27_010893 [termite gut metagenome]|uniref:Tyrosine specific protein phosphatases domain-containing protein n=1 Tax=termite gut metagenome TaxID=433724 RepID=A0A5J4S5E7_9ZZZZ
MNKIFVLSRFEFEGNMKTNGIDDENVEKYEDLAIISITDNPKNHLFKKDHDNVLNMTFDDVGEKAYENRHKVKKSLKLKLEDFYRIFSEKDAETIVDFIEKNKEKTFIIHCEAGISRSGAVGLFIRDFYDWVDKEDFDNRVKNKIYPNMLVLRLLKKEFYEKNYS